MTLSEQLVLDMKAAKGGSDKGTADEWCFLLKARLPSFTCPAPEDFGFLGSDRSLPVDYRTWASRLLLVRQIDALDATITVAGGGGTNGGGRGNGSQPNPPIQDGNPPTVSKKLLVWGLIGLGLWLLLKK